MRRDKTRWDEMSEAQLSHFAEQATLQASSCPG